MPQIPKHIVLLAREKRKNLTQEEFVAWQRLRNRRYRGYKFLRQHPLIYNWNDREVHFFIADFYCHQLKLVLEIDGAYHEFQKEQDEWRDEIIAALKLKTLRIKNEDCGRIYQILDDYFKGAGHSDSPPFPLSPPAAERRGDKPAINENDTNDA